MRRAPPTIGIIIGPLQNLPNNCLYGVALDVELLSITKAMKNSFKGTIVAAYLEV
jgi:hypothetical protein